MITSCSIAAPISREEESRLDAETHTRFQQTLFACRDVREFHGFDPDSVSHHLTRTIEEGTGRDNVTRGVRDRADRFAGFRGPDGSGDFALKSTVSQRSRSRCGNSLDTMVRLTSNWYP
ncbi:MAG: hypothetical protein R2845_15155 [Thermomicrobiales bacterium]